MTAEAQSLDAETYRSLPRNDQRAALDEAFAEQNPGPAAHSEAFRILKEARQESYPVSEGMSETEQAMAEALQQTWTATLFEHVDEHPEVPFEMRRLPVPVRELAMELANVLFAGEDVESEAELEELVADTRFESVDEFDEWLVQFLAFATVDESFDAERFRSGRGLVEGTRKHLMLELYLRHEEEAQQVAKFRTER